MRTTDLAGLICLLGFVTGLSAADAIDRRALDAVKASSVYIEADFGPQGGTGTGFFIDDGLIVTNAHVLGQTRERKLPLAGVNVVINSGLASKQRRLAAEVIGIDTLLDLAFLKLRDGNADVPRGLRIVESKDVYETMPVWIAGYPFGATLEEGRAPAITIGTGSVSSLRRDAEFEQFIDRIQIDGDINPGNSGGPIVNARGDVVAISVSTVVGTAIAFAIPGDQVRRELDGRLMGTTIAKARVDERGRYGFDYSLNMIDPYQRIDRFRVGVYTGPVGPKTNRPTRMTNFGIPHPTHGARGDSRIDWMWAERQDSKTFALTIEGVEIPNEHGLLLEFDLRRGSKRDQFFGGEFTRTELDEMVQRAGNRTPNAQPASPSHSSSGAATRRRAVRRGPLPEVVDAPILKSADLKRITIEEEPASVATIFTAPVVAMGSLAAAAADPTGSKVYIAGENAGQVTILDPAANYAEIGRIPCPKSPQAIWTDGELVAISCPESKLVLLANASDGKPIRAVQLNHLGKIYAPKDLVGRSASGELIITWLQQGGAWWDYAVTLVGDGDPTVINIGTAASNVVELGTGELILQGQRSSGPSATITTVTLDGQGGRGRAHGRPDNRFTNLEEVLGRFAERLIVPLHTDTGTCRFTWEQDRLLVPLRVGKRWVTMTTDPDLTDAQSAFAGWVVADSPAEGVFIALDQASVITGDTDDRGLAIRYLERSTGATIRVALPQSQRDERIIHPNRCRAICYVPGHEDLIVVDQQGVARRYATGPLDPGNSIQPREGTPTVDGREAAPPPPTGPPKTGAPGTAISFQPTAPNIPGLRFTLKNPQPGMKIDKRSGAWSWTPEAWQLGQYEVVIEAEMASGGTVTVKRWTITIGN